MRLICSVDTLAVSLCMLIMAASSAAEKAPQLGSKNEGIRVNQMGYLPKDDKKAFLTVTEARTGNWHIVKASDNTTVYTGSDLGEDIGYKSGLYVYALDFSPFTESGTYYVSGGGSKSPQFKINSGFNIYRRLLDPTLGFYGYQVCGSAAGRDVVAGFGNCHRGSNCLQAWGGPENGANVSTRGIGAYHDADNNPKPVITEGFTAINLMLADMNYGSHGIYAGMTHTTINQVKPLLDWINRMWVYDMDPAKRVLYAAKTLTYPDSATDLLVACNADQSSLPAGFRIPEFVARNNTGAGANIAGIAAATLALGSQYLVASDPALAATYKTSAKQIYDYGKSHQKSWRSPQHYDPTEFSKDPAKGWKGPMALAAAELARIETDPATKAAYINEGTHWLYGTNGANREAFSCDWTDGWIPIANYELARVSPSHAAAAKTYLANAINGLGSDKFGAAYGDNENFQWGTVGILAHKAIWGIMYNELSGTATYNSFINRQRNYIFGANPWGCSFVNGAVTSGTSYSRNCYNSSKKTGWWGEGPADHATIDAQGFAHAAPGSFDKPNCYYEDSSRNWVTNEVTIQANAEGFWLLSYYASLGAVAPVSPASP